MSLPPAPRYTIKPSRGLTANVTEGWAKASCTGPVQASLLYRLYQQSGTPVGEASVNAETSTDTIFVTFAQTATGVAYANPNNISAPISFVLFDSSGNQLGATHDHSRAHGSRYLANPGPLLQLGSFTGLVEITSPLPIISLSLNRRGVPGIFFLAAGRSAGFHACPFLRLGDRAETPSARREFLIIF